MSSVTPSTSVAAPARGEGAAQAPTLRVAVLAGGRSAEHDVSIVSAESVREGLLAAGHEVLSVGISREGRWLLDGEALALRPGEGLLGADVVFPALHGPFGEDGTVQGALEVLDVAYVGAGVAASAICMNKVLFKDLVEGDLPQVAYRGISEHVFRADPAVAVQTLEPLGMPVFVKPARMGSSLGIAKVAVVSELPGALEQALAHDELVIVEAMAQGMEVECAVLGGLPGEQALVSRPGQVSFHGDWYDFDTKYRPGGIELTVPAPIAEQAAEQVRALALEVFRRVGCEDLARVDFFVDRDRVLVNELNTMPGFTPTSVYAKLIEHAGIGYSQLVDRLCRSALARYQRRRERQP
jgi:D-alanine-D-alanine ligase